jgi:hypothetical protein
MWPWSDSAAAALTRSHTAVSRVDIWQSGRPTGVSLVAVGGSVSTDADRPVRRNLTCTLVDPTGELSTGDVDDLLDPYECEIAPWRGVQYRDAAGNKVTELAPQGVFQLTGRDVDDSPDGLTIRLTGQDRAMRYQGPMSSALAISGGTLIEDAIAALAATRQPGVSMSAMSTGYPTGPLVFQPDEDVWSAMQKLAESVGGVVYHDRTGQLVFALRGPTNDNAVAAYAEGDGLLLSVSRTEDSDTIKNVVVAEAPSGLIRAVVEDDDPFSPTYAGGRYGRRVHTLVNPHFSSVTQAQQAATARLAYELGRSETVTFSAVVDPGLDVDEVVTVHRPRAGLTQRGVVVASTEVPLSCEEAMSVGCRQSRLAPDGKVLREP